MFTIAGGIILALVGIVVLLFLVSITFRVIETFKKRAQERPPKGNDAGCPTCQGRGRIQQTGGLMTFQIDCPTCQPFRR